MIVLLKIAVILICSLIAYQDFKQRMVLWVLFPLLGFCLGSLYIYQTAFEQFYPLITTNITLVSTIIVLLFLYTKYIKKMKFLNVSFGLGDLLFFYAFALGFPTITFIILFVSSILFALSFQIAINNKKEKQTIPLAGLMGIFLVMVLLLSLFPNTPVLYVL